MNAKISLNIIMITVIANLKGGTGKSTVTFNLAVWLCLNEIETTVIDLDPQKTLTDVAGLRLEERINPPVHVRCGPLPHTNLLQNAGETLIDVGTADLKAFKQALKIADRVLIPVTPSQADIWSTQRFVQFLDRITRGNPPESITFINRADTNRAIPASDEAAAALDSLPGVELIPQRLYDRPVFRNSFSEGLAVFELEPRSRGSAEFNALAAVLFSYKGSAEQDHPAKADARNAANSIAVRELAGASVDQAVAQKSGYHEHSALTAVENGRHRRGEVEEQKKKRRSKKDKKAGKGKKPKKREKAKKHKHSKKDKKRKKANKGNKG